MLSLTAIFTLQYFQKLSQQTPATKKWLCWIPYPQMRPFSIQQHAALLAIGTLWPVKVSWLEGGTILDMDLHYTVEIGVLTHGY